MLFVSWIRYRWSLNNRMHKYSSCHFGDIQISRDLDLPLKEDVISAWYYFGSKIRKSDYNKDICRIEFEFCITVRFLFFLFWFDSMRIRNPCCYLLWIISRMDMMTKARIYSIIIVDGSLNNYRWWFPCLKAITRGENFYIANFHRFYSTTVKSRRNEFRGQSVTKNFIAW